MTLVLNTGRSAAVAVTVIMLIAMFGIGRLPEPYYPERGGAGCSYEALPAGGE